jgi:DNA-binding response OmpR family regulator
MPGETILLVDDEPNIIELAKLYLENDGYRVVSAADGVEALKMVVESNPALMVLDLMLPEMDGWEVCRRIRSGGDYPPGLPIIMLTARDDDVDKIVGLELGADDYIIKPFNPRELVARVKAVLRRATKGAAVEPEKESVEFGPLRIYPDRREASLGGEELHLRGREFDLLLAFVRNRGAALTREKLLDLAWGYESYVETRTVDVHVARLRVHLADSPVQIETVWGVGYKLVLDE